MQKIITGSLLPLASFALFSANALAQTNQPSLQILSPQENQTINGDDIPILISVENFTIVDFAKFPANQNGQGHIHAWLDEQNPTKENAIKMTDDTYTFENVAPGQHTLVAELVNNNHSSLTPPQKTTVKFINSPTSSPVPTAASGFDKNTALVILVIVTLVIIAAWWYTKDEEETSEELEQSKPKTTRNKAKKTVKKKK